MCMLEDEQNIICTLKIARSLLEISQKSTEKDSVCMINQVAVLDTQLISTEFVDKPYIIIPCFVNQALIGEVRAGHNQ